MISRVIVRFRKEIFYFINRKKFAYLHPQSFVDKLLRVDGRENISIGKNVVIQKMSWIAALPLTDASVCHLSIGEGSVIGNFNHIYATGEILIGKNVLTADKVFISDNIHAYENISIPIMSQGIKQLPKVVIGNGAWLGENVCVIGASVGRNSVIGANSVVTKDIPDFCVAVGAPAKVIKKFNLENNKWERI